MTLSLWDITTIDMVQTHGKINANIKNINLEKIQHLSL